MERLAVKTARTLSQISIRNSQSSSLLQKRAFQSISSIQAETTITTPKANLPFPSYPRSASSALLGLDVPDTFDSRLRPAYSEFGGKKVAGGSTGERQASSLRNSRNIESLMSRKWRSGDVYTPHDLTPREVMKFKTTKRPSRDIFDALGINPLDHYKNPVLLAEFMTPGGRIKHSRDTGLRPVNQRKIAKAIRRAIGMGLMPKCHVHPEMLRRRGPDARTQKYQWQ